MHVVPNSEESCLKKAVAQKKFCAHTDFEKLEGTLFLTYNTLNNVQ